MKLNNMKTKNMKNHEKERSWQYNDNNDENGNYHNDGYGTTL